MAIPNEHAAFLKLRCDFRAELSSVLKPPVIAALEEDDVEMLNRYYPWMFALVTSQIPPITSKQIRFLECAYGMRKPVTKYEKCWHKIRAVVGQAKLRKLETQFLRREASSGRPTLFCGTYPQPRHVLSGSGAKMVATGVMLIGDPEQYYVLCPEPYRVAGLHGPEVSLDWQESLRYGLQTVISSMRWGRKIEIVSPNMKIFLDGRLVGAALSIHEAKRSAINHAWLCPPVLGNEVEILFPDISECQRLLVRSPPFFSDEHQEWQVTVGDESLLARLDPSGDWTLRNL